MTARAATRGSRSRPRAVWPGRYLLRRASAAFLFRHPGQLGLALFGIVAGVAVMVAVDLANTSSERAFLLSLDTLNGRATHQVTGGPGGIDENEYVRLRVEEGVRSLAPIVEGRASSGGLVYSVIGVDVFAEAGFRAYSAPSGTAGGSLDGIRRLLVEPGAMLLAPSARKRLEVESGGTVQLGIGGVTVDAQVVGELSGDDERLANLIITDIATAQDWFGMTGRLSRIDMRVDGNTRSVDEIRELLPPALSIEATETRSSTMLSMTSAFMTNLSAMSLLAMLVGLFLIYNSVSFVVLQRRPLIGTLRALGLTRGEAFRLILVEGALLGAVGATLGVLAGLWLGDALLGLVSRSINDLYFRISVTDVTPGPAVLVKGLLAGMAATLVATALPAAEAASVRPSLSIRRSGLESGVARIALLLAACGAGLAVLALVVIALSGQSLVAGLVALFGLIVGMAFVVPSLVRFSVPFLAALAGKLGGSAARLAVSGIRDSLSRTGVAIVALAVAVSATIGVTIMVDSFRIAVSDWLGTTLQADMYVGVPGGTLRADVVADIAAAPGVASTSSSRRAWVDSERGRVRVITLRMAPGSYAGTELLDADPARVWPQFDAGDAVLVSETFAFRHALGLGDEIRLRTREGMRSFAIAATYRSYDANQGAVLMNRAAYLQHWDDANIDSVGLYLAPDASPGAVSDRLLALIGGRQDVSISDTRSIREISMAVFDRTFVITDVLYWLATGVAITGIFGAMLAFQLERRAELGLLRALGMTPAEIGGLVTLQATLMGLLAGLAAIPLGLIMAEVLIDVINRRSFGWSMTTSVDGGQLTKAVLLSGAAALVAGLYPAWRSGQVSPARAMREE